MLEIKGYVGAAIEMILFASVAYLLRVGPLKGLAGVHYYWFCFTILTAYWEIVFVHWYNYVALYAHALKEANQSVWTTYYPITMIAPNHLSCIFYADYGAWGDREYMNISIHGRTDYWSRLIESTHMIFCGFVCLASLLATYRGYGFAGTVLGCAAMGAQCMNSVMYLAEYLLQCNDPKSVNANNATWPTGSWMLGRPFMWVNFFWTVMPIFIIYRWIVTQA